MADLRGGARDERPPDLNSFNVMQFLGKFGEIVCWRPPGSWRSLLEEILDPPLDRYTVISGNIFGFSAYFIFRVIAKSDVNSLKGFVQFILTSVS